MNDKTMRDLEKKVNVEKLKVEAAGFTDESCITMIRNCLQKTADIALAIFVLAKESMGNKHALGVAFNANSLVIGCLRQHVVDTDQRDVKFEQMTIEEREQLVEETASKHGLNEDSRKKLREAEQDIDVAFNRLAANPDSIEDAAAYCLSGDDKLPVEDRDEDVCAAICRNLHSRGLRAFAAAAVANEIMHSGLSELLNRGLEIAKRVPSNRRASF